MASKQTIGRLSLYRRALNTLLADGVQHVYSHTLAELTGATAAQVRRDMMAVGCSGNSKTGYRCEDLIRGIGNMLDDQEGQQVALVGVGNLGRAIMAYFAGRRPKLSIAAAFDRDPYKVDRVIHGCRCYPMEKLAEIVADQKITIGIIAVNAVSAQDVADALVEAGITGLLNFAPVFVRIPPTVFMEDIDITTSLEKVAYFARQKPEREE